MAYAELTLDQGTTFSTNLDLIADDGTAINLTNYVFSSQIRKTFYSVNPTANIQITLVDAANGIVSLTVDAANTSNIPDGRYVYDIKIKDTSNVVSRIVEGIITVTPQVTR
jgi:hypothetical protein